MAIVYLWPLYIYGHCISDIRFTAYDIPVGSFEIFLAIIVIEVLLLLYLNDIIL
jgi:hypothetical protein